jgi:actin-related protein
MVLQCLLRCAVDTRAVVAANVVLTGGLCETPGLGARLKLELRRLVDTVER